MVSRPFHDHLHGLEVISFDFSIRHTTVSLSRGDPAMAQKILYSDQLCIGVEHLRGHGMTELMTRYPELCLFRIILHPFLNASDRQGLLPIGAFLIQEDLLAPGWWSHPEIVTQRSEGIITDVDNSVPSPLGIVDGEHSSYELYGSKAEVGNLCHPQATAKHQHEHGPIPWDIDGLEENIQLLLVQVFGKGLRHPEAIALFDWVRDRYLLLVDQVMIELSDPLQVAVDGLCLELAPHEKVDIV